MSFGSILMIACAAVYFYIGRMEYKSGLQLAMISGLLWWVVDGWMGWGWFGALVAQVALFVALSMWNARHVRRKQESTGQEATGDP